MRPWGSVCATETRGRVGRQKPGAAVGRETAGSVIQKKTRAMFIEEGGIKRVEETIGWTAS